MKSLEIWNCAFCGAEGKLEREPKDHDDFFKIHEKGCDCPMIDYRRGKEIYRRVKGRYLSRKKG